MDILLKILPSAGTIVGVIIVLFLAQRVLEKGVLAGKRLRNQLIMLGLTAVGLLVIILVIPMGEAMRGQLLSFLGIVLSAAVALSSTTFLGNAMAGVMLRAVRNFRTGDFIRCGEHFGRVSERGLFHTEIQTEYRDLITLPNLHLAVNPTMTIRSSGTFVSATVSLGYDVPRTRIEQVLLDAALEAELTDPFVQILELGDFSVTYRISGLLTEVKQLISARSRLRAAMMDKLHEADVEIVSPNFMNTRALAEGKLVVPERVRVVASAEPTAAPEDLVFDKAEEAESLESLMMSLKSLGEEIQGFESKIKVAADGPDRVRLESELSRRQHDKARLEQIITARQAKVGEKD